MHCSTVWRTSSNWARRSRAADAPGGEGGACKRKFRGKTRVPQLQLTGETLGLALDERILEISRPTLVAAVQRGRVLADHHASLARRRRGRWSSWRGRRRGGWLGALLGEMGDHVRLGGRVPDDLRVVRVRRRFRGRQDGLGWGARHGLEWLLLLLLAASVLLLLRGRGRGEARGGHRGRRGELVTRVLLGLWLVLVQGLEAAAGPHAPRAVHEAAAVGVHVVRIPAHRLFVHLGRGGDGGGGGGGRGVVCVRRGGRRGGRGRGRRDVRLGIGLGMCGGCGRCCCWCRGWGRCGGDRDDVAFGENELVAPGAPGGIHGSSGLGVGEVGWSSICEHADTSGTVARD